MTMFIHHFCLCPLGFTIKLNFNQKWLIVKCNVADKVHVFLNFLYILGRWYDIGGA